MIKFVSVIYLIDINSILIIVIVNFILILNHTNDSIFIDKKCFIYWFINK